MVPTVNALVESFKFSPANARRLAPALHELELLGCKQLEAKLAEYRNRGDFPSLMGELRVARAISAATKEAITFQAGKAADLRACLGGIDCTIEVQLKSTADAFSAVFYPTEEDLDVYRTSPCSMPWMKSSVRLHHLVRTHAIEIEPSTYPALDEPIWGGKERTERETLCGQIADWLCERLGSRKERCTSRSS